MKRSSSGLQDPHNLGAAEGHHMMWVWLWMLDLAEAGTQGRPGPHLEACAVERQQLQRLCELVAGRAAGLPVELLLCGGEAPVRRCRRECIPPVMLESDT